jgi:putative Mg2+ transporter-C (MgtC) family protein
MINWEAILKLVLAIAIGTLIGSEREKSGKPVGRRTLSIVTVGAAFAIILSLQYFPDDTGRIISGIITGLGFLGAGAIIAEGSYVRGLTTAASIWSSAIIGIGIGLGEYPLSIIGGVVLYIILSSGRIMDTLKGKKK